MYFHNIKMKKVANILFNDQNSFSDFKGCHALFNLTTDTADLIPTIPTLYTCYRRAKELFPTINILDKNIPGTNDYWTFNKKDKIVDYFNVLEAFRHDFIYHYFNNYNYVVFNRLFNDIKLPEYLMSKKVYAVYRNTRSIFYYYDNEILGIDIHYLMFVDPKLYKVLNNLQFTDCKYILNDKDGQHLNYFKSEIPEHKDIIEKYIGLFL